MGQLTSVLILTRPVILALVAMSGFSAMVLAAGGLPATGNALAGGTVLLLSAAGSAMLNSVLDYPLDCRMPRLAARIRALETLGRTKAIQVATTLIVAGVLVSVVYLDLLVTLLTVAAVFGYLVPYTLHLKRTSPFGAIPGGIPGALPVLIGYAAIKPIIGLDGLILFLLVLLWQPPHFWTLALRYQEDYRAAGLPVLPATLGKRYTKTFILLYATALLPLSLSLWFFGYCSAVFAVLALLSGSIFLVILVRSLLFTSRLTNAFHATNGYLTLLLLLIVADFYLR